MNKEQYKSLVNWYYIEDWSDYPGPKGRVVPDAEGYDNPSNYDGTELYISQGTIGNKEGNLFIDEEGNDVPFNSEYFINPNHLKENKMTQEQLRMQMLAGIITEGQYKVKLNEAEEYVPYQFDDEKGKELYLKYDKSYENPSWTRGEFPNSKEIDLQTLLDITGMSLEELKELNTYGDEGWKLDIDEDNEIVTEFVD